MTWFKGYRITLSKSLLYAFLTSGLIQYWLLYEPSEFDLGKKLIKLNKILGDTSFKKFTKITDDLKIQFPRDHGAHKQFRSEWWYFTGRLKAKNSHLKKELKNREFGFQFTIFRSYTGHTENKAHEWGSRQIYMGHFALSDLMSEKFYSFEKMSREAVSTAGISQRPFKAWVDHWKAASVSKNKPPNLKNEDSFLPIQIEAQEDGVSVRILLDNRKPLLLQGENGYSRKGEKPESASAYYSYTSLSAKGEIKIHNQTFEVYGSGWFDHEWSSNVLEKGVEGWDWFSIQLNNQNEMMLYNLRKEDGSIHQAFGVIVDKSGTPHKIDTERIKLEPTSFWKSSQSQIAYPTSWEIQMPSYQIKLNLKASFDQQEHLLSIIYWEGTIDITGTFEGSSVAGTGYMELTGY